MEKRAQYKIETLYVSSAKTRYYGLGLFHKNICLIDYAFKFGSDEVSIEEAFSSKYDSVWGKVNSSFTGLAKKKIHIDLVEEEFKPIFKDLRSILLHYSVKGPTIGCRPNHNYTNVSAWDVKSAYPYWVYTAEFPYTFMQVPDKLKGRFMKKPHCGYFGRFTIKNFKPKDPHYLPLFLKHDGLDENDVDVLTCNRRIAAGVSYSGYGFLNLLLPIIKNNYTYESIEFDWDQMWIYETKQLPQETRDACLDLFDTKESTKLHSDKLILNRTSYGLFITHKTRKDGTKDAADYEVPYQVGIYIVALQAHYMDSVIQKGGVEHLISTHTDSIKFDYDIAPIIYKENNRRHCYKNLGMWEPEDVKECCYYSNTRAKILTSKGKVEIKHGGISEDDVIEFCRDKDYNSISGESPIMLTRHRTLAVDEKGTHIVLNKVPVKFSSDLSEEENYELFNC